MIDLTASSILSSRFRPQFLDAEDQILKPPRLGACITATMSILHHVYVENLRTEYMGWLNQEMDRLLASPSGAPRAMP